jgi:nicotinate-nucleotide pyrophosphorylase (carboxylating)
MVKVQVEVDNLEQLEEALACRVDAVLLDNMDPPRLHEAVTKVAGRLITEASGNIDLTNAREVAATGVHLLSAGWITHSAPVLDLALEIETERG